MIEVVVNINRKTTVKAVQAVRIHPTQYLPIIGEECTYKMYIDMKETGKTITHPYGDGVTLAIKMLEFAKENS